MRNIVNKLKRALKRKPVKVIGVLTLIVVVATIAIVTVSALTITKVSNNTILSSDYGWSFKFMSGVTNVTTGGMTNYAQDASPACSTCVTARITSANQKGNIWIRYNNVGTYNDKIIDLKITLTDWEYLEPAKSTSTSYGYPTLVMPTTSIGINMTFRPQIYHPVFTFQFYEHGTNNLVQVKGHNTFVDIDGKADSTTTAYENANLTSGFKNLYSTSDSKVRVISGNRIGNDSLGQINNDDKAGWLTFTYDTSSFSFTYDLFNERKESPESYPRNFYSVFINSSSVAPIDIPNITKSVNKTEITNDDTLEYTIHHSVPGEDSSFYYTQYEIEDVIPSAFTVKSYKVIDDYGKDRSGWFDYTIDSTTNKIKFTAKSTTLNSAAFYNNNYDFKVTVQKKNGYDMSSWYSDSKSVIPNTAKLTVKGPTLGTARTVTKNSNTVNVAAYQKIYTSATNATISPSNGTKVVSGSNTNVVFTPNSGYYISKITIDGTSYTYSSGDSITIGDKNYKIAGDTIIFDNVAKDHTVSVEATLLYKVTTSIDHGTITPNVTNISPSSNKEVTFTPSSGYYIKKITIDGTSYSYSSGSTIAIGNKTYNILGDKYTFNNIQANHVISVETATLYKITTKIDHGTITENISNIMPNTEKTITYTPAKGYYVVQLLVDGTTSTSFTKTGGTYKFSNIDANHSIEVRTLPYKFSISGTKEDISTKSTAQGNATLQGAKIGVFYHRGFYDSSEEPYEENELVCEAITNASGAWSCPGTYPVGNYTIKETKAPTGYNLSTEEYKFTRENSDAVTYTVKDKVITAEVGVLKQYGNKNGTTAPEPNAKFDLILKSNNKLFGTITTNSEGRGSLKNIPYGEYKLCQTAGDKNYWMQTECKNISVNTEGAQLTQYLVNDEVEAHLRVTKIDQETKRRVKMANISFEIIDSSGNKVCQNNGQTCQYSTNADGVAMTLETLGHGSYTLVEVNKPMDGYLYNNARIPFKIDSEQVFTEDSAYGLIVDLTFENQPVKGKITINKTGQTVEYKNNQFVYSAKLLANTKFALYAKEDIYDKSNTLIYHANYLVSTGVTDSDGNIVFDNLPLGKYYAKEVKTSSAYILSNRALEFNLEYINQGEPIVSIWATLNNSLKKGRLKVSKVDSISKQPLQGAVFDLHYLDSEGDHIIYSGTTNRSGSLEKVDLPYGQYYIVEKMAPNKYIYESNKHYFDISNDGQQVLIEVENTKYSDLTITKRNVKGETLAGVEIDVYKVDEYNGHKLIHSGITDTEGKIHLETITKGNYYYVEKSTLAGYILDETHHDFVIDQDSKSYSFDLVNEHLSNLTISKVDINNNPLAGIKINIYKHGTNELFYEGITDSEGKIYVEEIPIGNYYYQEKQTLPGYILDNNKYDFSIDKNDSSFTQSLFNEHYSNVTITKYDALGVNTVSNVKINVYNADTNKLLYAGVTDHEGKIIVNNIPIGHYYYKEVEVPYGYVLNEEMHPFSISKNDSAYEYSFNNNKYSYLTIINKDTKEAPLNIGSTIEIYKVNEDNSVELFYSGTHDESGKIYIDLIPKGSYYYIQTSTRNDYELNSSIYPFIIDQYDSNYEYEIINEHLSNLTVIKENIHHEKLANAEIEIYKVNKDESVELFYEGTTTEEGKIYIDLIPRGSYYYIEKVAPKGYALDKAQHPFIIDKNESSYEYIFTNEHYSNLTITKKNLSGTEVVPDAIIDIYRINETEDVLFHTSTTDSEGKIYVDEIPKGSYYYVEKEAPEDYQINDQKHYFDIEYNDYVYSYNFTNEQYSRIEFYKHDIEDSSILLEGAKMCVYTEERKEVGCVITDKNGFASMPLIIGKYYYKEIEAPTGYFVEEEIHHFEIKEENSVYVADIFDEYMIAAPITDITYEGLVESLIILLVGINFLLISLKNAKKGMK